MSTRTRGGGTGLTREEAADPPQETLLDVTLYPQLTDMWCWAASTQMVLAFWGVDAPQCVQANDRLGMQSCCILPTPTECIQGNVPDYGHWGFTSEVTRFGTALSFRGLTEQFGIGCPVTFAWSWVGGGGHVMVACGVNTTELGEMVYSNNPWPPETGDGSWITYAAFVSRPGVYTHQMDWFNTMPEHRGGHRFGQASAAATTGRARMQDDSAGAAPARFDDARAAAQAGMRLLAALPAPAGSEGTGVAGAELADLEPAEPLRIFYVRRDALARHEPGTDPRPLLFDTGEVLYPVAAGGAVASAVRVLKQEGAWTVRSVGEPRLARDLDAVRAADAAASGAAPSEYFVVHVPSLYQIFVGRLDPAGRLVLSPVYDDQARGFVRGRAQPGEALLARLVPDARAGRSAIPEAPRD